MGAAGANFNFMALIEKQAEYLADMMVHMRDTIHKSVVNVTPEAEMQWAEHCAVRTMLRPLHPQAAGANFNFMALIEKQAEYLADMMVHMRDTIHKSVVNVTPEA